MQDLKSLKHELQYIIQSDEQIGQRNLIKAAQIILRRLEETGTKAKEKKPDRAEEERALEKFAFEESLWLSDELLGDYITEGAEQKIYHKEKSTAVFKISDGIFYQNWLDYINNLLLHNSFFRQLLIRWKDLRGSIVYLV